MNELDLLQCQEELVSIGFALSKVQIGSPFKGASSFELTEPQPALQGLIVESVVNGGILTPSGIERLRYRSEIVDTALHNVGIRREDLQNLQRSVAVDEKIENLTWGNFFSRQTLNNQAERKIERPQSHSVRFNSAIVDKFCKHEEFSISKSVHLRPFSDGWIGTFIEREKYGFAVILISSHMNFFPVMTRLYLLPYSEFCLGELDLSTVDYKRALHPLWIFMRDMAIRLSSTGREEISETLSVFGVILEYLKAGKTWGRLSAV